MIKRAQDLNRRQLMAAVATSLALPSLQLRAAEKLTIFAAASVKEAFDETAAAFMAGGGPETSISYAASSQLARQIANGAPADIFISADLEWMDWLEQGGHIERQSRRTLLGNSLVMIGGADSTQRLTLDSGLDLDGLIGNGRMVIAEPSSVPAGRYARQALENLGLWTKSEKKLVFAANVRAALALVARGEAGFGIVYATDAMAESKVKIIGRFDPASHAPILYPIAKTRQGSAGADAFLAFLTTPAARTLFERYGFRYLFDSRA